MVLLVIRLKEMRINCGGSRDLNQIYDATFSTIFLWYLGLCNTISYSYEKQGLQVLFQKRYALTLINWAEADIYVNFNPFYPLDLTNNKGKSILWAYI